jgi:hypothetical protein
MQGFKINKQFKLKREEGAAGDIQTGTIASRTQLRASVKTCIFFKIKRAAGRSRYSIPSHHALYYRRKRQISFRFRVPPSGMLLV